jgi:hypothetical protein
MPRHTKSLALKKFKQRNWLRGPPASLDLNCQRRFLKCQVFGPRIFFLNRKPKSAIDVSSDPKPFLNPTLVHLLCLGSQYCLWEHVTVFGLMGVCVCACMQAILCLANNYKLVVLQFLQYGIRLRLPSIWVFQDCGAEPAKLGGPAILVSVLVPTFRTCLHIHSFDSHIFILLSVFRLLQYKREVGAVQEPLLSLSERIRSRTWEGAS